LGWTGTRAPEINILKRHSFKFVLGAASFGVLAAVLFLAWHVGVPLIFGYHAAAPDAKPKAVDFNNPKQILAEADRYAWVFSSQEAGPLYARAEQLFAKSRDEASETHARVGLIRARAETMSFVDISQSLATELKRPVVQNDPKLKLWVLTAKGYTDIEINPSAAKAEWREAREIADRLGEKQWVERADGELAIFGFLDGDSTRAARLIGSALVHAMMYGDAGGQIRFQEMIGNGLAQERRYENALYFFNRAMRIAKDTPDVGFPFMAYEGKADALLALGHADEARALLLDALKTAKQLRKEGHQTQALMLLGELAEKVGDRKSAIDYLEQAAAIGTRLGFDRMVGQTMFDLARVYEEQGDTRLADARLTTGLAASQRIGDKYFLPRDLTALADLKAREGHLADADRLYDQAEDVIDAILANLPGPYGESSLANSMSETYLKHLQLVIGQNDIDKAFQIVERIRGRTLADRLRRRPTKGESDSPAIATVVADISAAEMKLMQSQSAEERLQLREGLLGMEERLAYARGQAVQIGTRSQIETPPSLNAVQSMLATTEVLLEYVLNEPQSTCLAITRDAAKIYTLPAGRGKIEEATRAYLETLGVGQSPGLDKARTLYSMLLSPITEVGAKLRLTIIADGALHLLPFQALVDQEGQPVVYTHVVSYSPSATVLNILRGRQKDEIASRPYLGIGGIVYDGETMFAQVAQSDSIPGRVLRGLEDFAGYKLPNLSQSKEEVLYAGRLAGPKSVLLLGRGATKSAFKAEPLGDFRVIHFAVHSSTSRKFPERDALVLAKSDNSDDDGVLQVREIDNLAFKADLVTLSACDTGVGKLQGEEGVTNLANAFLFAGAKAVVASLWPAEDQATSALMERFYFHLAQGEDKALSLRGAQLDMLKQYGKQTTPFFWAGFVLVGDGSSGALLKN
jgi:CHAT domain-containing protein